MATKRNFIQRTSDGKYLNDAGSWVTGNASARSLTSRSDVQAVVQSKQPGIYRMVKEYRV